MKHSVVAMVFTVKVEFALACTCGAVVITTDVDNIPSRVATMKDHIAEGNREVV